MIFEIILLSGAEADLLRASADYELRTPGMGERFLEVVDARLATLAENPQLGKIYRHPFRRLLVLKYPYGIFYETAGNRVIIHTVQNLRQDPTRIIERIFES